MTESDQTIIQQTKNWLVSVVIDLNFCPFACQEFENDTIHYCVVRKKTIEASLESFMIECQRLDQHQNIATSLLIYPSQWQNFDDFLHYLAIANDLLETQNYPGIYQIASFHPDYCFAGETKYDPANYTNRSPYPMLHLLREARMEKALLNYPNPEQIQENNIQCARSLGEEKFRTLLAACKK